MSLPTLTLCVLTYKRPQYGILSLRGLLDHLRYDGPVRFLIVDGGSPDWHLQMYAQLLGAVSYQIVQRDGFPAMLSACAEHDGELWLTVLDDFVLSAAMDVTPDVRLLLEHADIGHIRMGRMAHWDVPKQTVYAELRGHGPGCAPYWVLDKERSSASYMWTLGFGITHRRMWDAYAPLTPTPAHQPGEAELAMNEAFKTKAGPTVAVPMRLWAGAGMSLPLGEAVRHLGYVRTDEYTHAIGDGEAERWGQV
jgi:hypothetical protein